MNNLIDGLSMNIEQTNLDKLRSVFPEVSWTLTSCFLCAASTSTMILKSTSLNGKARRTAYGWPRSDPPAPCAPAWRKV